MNCHFSNREGPPVKNERYKDERELEGIVKHEYDSQVKHAGGGCMLMRSAMPLRQSPMKEKRTLSPRQEGSGS